MTNPAILMGEGLASKALSDPNFFVRMPEFSSLKVKMQAMKADLTATTGGCSNCRKRRVVRTLFSDFMAVLLSLSRDGVERVKQYFGTPALLVHHMDPATGKVSSKTL